MEARFNPLDSEYTDNDSVVSFPSPRCTFKVDELWSAVQVAFGKAGFNELVNRLRERGRIPEIWEDWSIQGVDCEVLKLGARSWRKGKLKIKVSLEFCPDEPDIAEISASNQSELDVLRKAMNHKG